MIGEPTLPSMSPSPPTVPANPAAAGATDTSPAGKQALGRAAATSPGAARGVQGSANRAGRSRGAGERRGGASAAGRAGSRAVTSVHGAAQAHAAARQGKVSDGAAKVVDTVRQLVDELAPEAKNEDLRRTVPGASGRLQGLAESIERSRDLLQRMFRPRGGIGGAAGQRYGDAIASEVNQILNSNMSLEEKFMLICALLADKLEKDIEGEMRKWSQAISGQSAKVQNGQGAGGSQGASAAAENQQSQARQAETKIQMMMQRLNRLMSMVSNCLASNHKAKMAAIGNIRA